MLQSHSFLGEQEIWRKVGGKIHHPATITICLIPIKSKRELVNLTLSFSNCYDPI
jgi:hypothetical protein